jgi:hypothetical protein
MKKYRRTRDISPEKRFKEMSRHFLFYPHGLGMTVML